MDKRRGAILENAIGVFGRFGYQKTSVQDLAAAAGLSKPGLYLHFKSKDEVFASALDKYLADGLRRVRDLLAATETPLDDRLRAALEAWFGRHLTTFQPPAFDVIEAGDRLDQSRVQGLKDAFRAALAEAFESAGFLQEAAVDRAEVLFACGLSWKQPGMTPEQFRRLMTTCVRVCCDTPA